MQVATSDSSATNYNTQPIENIISSIRADFQGLVLANCPSNVKLKLFQLAEGKSGMKLNSREENKIIGTLASQVHYIIKRLKL
jgi:hypothetical protein